MQSVSAIRMRRSLFVFLGILGVLGLAACGGDSSGGAGQCGGSENNGVCLFVSSIAPADVDEGPDVDVVQNPDCTGGVAPVPVAEDFVNARAVVTFGAFIIGPAPVVANTIFITGYTITYTAIAAPVVGPAIPPVPVTALGSTVAVPVGAIGTGLAELFTLGQKAVYPFPGVNRTYTVTYTFSGEDDFGESVSVTASTVIDLNNFDNC